MGLRLRGMGRVWGLPLCCCCWLDWCPGDRRGAGDPCWPLCFLGEGPGLEAALWSCGPDAPQTASMRETTPCISLSTDCRGALPALAAAAATAACVARSWLSKCLMTSALLLSPPLLMLLPPSDAAHWRWCCGEGERLGEGCRRSCPDTTISSESTPASASAPSSWLCSSSCPRDCCRTDLLRPCREMRRAWPAGAELGLLDPLLGLDEVALRLNCWASLS
jgi:hypothetical protein